MKVHRTTKSANILLEAFDTTKTAISTVELVLRFKDKLNKTTVYRNLEKLEKQGVLHSFLGKDAVTWYAKCSCCTANSHNDVHPHFQCLDCGAVDCLSVDVQLPQIPNRKIYTSQVLLQGVCDRCM